MFKDKSSVVFFGISFLAWILLYASIVFLIKMVIKNLFYH
jgi:hypothetical protein